MLNYLNNDIVKSSVIYLYKTPKGAAKPIQLFAIPSLADKLNFMGQCKVFIDANLHQLYQEIITIKAVAMSQTI
ncbi:hypothetical protein D5085_03795 [Ectothiorhodospiraceae bacterium BW-2]|nr:hypothetical protein D5085_03795 [Ectothiorhodospiraceae bacterium BW-2]